MTPYSRKKKSSQSNERSDTIVCHNSYNHIESTVSCYMLPNIALKVNSKHQSLHLSTFKDDISNYIHMQYSVKIHIIKKIKNNCYIFPYIAFKGTCHYKHQSLHLLDELI